jgi:ferritin-like metal-binding protein YciE
MATVNSILNAMADDEIIKTCISAYGLANVEAAAYATLALFAEVAGHAEAVPELEQSMREEESMANFVAQHLPEFAQRLIDRRAKGRQASH